MSKTQLTLSNCLNKVKREDTEIKCSGCGIKFHSLKIKWHRDFECKKGKSQNKPLNKAFHSELEGKKKIQKEIEQSSYSKSLLSNSEQPEVFIIDEDPLSSVLNIASTQDNIQSPSPILFNMEEEEAEYLQKINDLSTDEENTIDVLKKDWDTPQSTPIKDEKIDILKKNWDTLQSVPIKKERNTLCTSNYSPSMSGCEKMADKKLQRSFSNSSVSSDFSFLGSSHSENEFEHNNVVLRSPSQRNLKKKIKSTPKKTACLKKNLEGSHLLQNNRQTVFSEIAKSLNKACSQHQKTDAMYSGNSASNFEETCNHVSMLVSPIRTPTPSPDHSSKTLNLSQHIVSTPERFHFKKTLLDLKEASGNNVLVEVASSPGGSSCKSIPRSLLKSAQNTLQGSYVSSSLFKVRRKLNISTDSDHASSSQGSLTPSKTSPVKYRNKKGMYLENFLHIIDTVTSQPEDLKLFNTDDLKVINGFHSLTLKAQKLYVRLFQRKVKWNRASKLNYPEICDKEDIHLYINELVYAGFLLSEESLTNLKELLLLLDGSEIKTLCKNMKITVSGKKDKLMNKLVKCEHQQKSLLASFYKEEKETKIMKLVKQAVCKGFILNKDPWNVFMRIFLLYSPLRFEEDEEIGQKPQLTTLLMVSIGRMKFPNYKVNRCHTLFQSREDVLRFQDCLQLLCEIQECFKSQAWESAVKLCKKADEIYLKLQNNEKIIKHDRSLPPFLRRFTTLSLVCYMQSLSVEAYQRLKQYGKAVKQLERLLKQKIYLQDCRGRWYDRLALNLHQHLKKPKKCLEVIKESLDDPEVRVGHRLSLSRRAERLLAAKGNEQAAQDFEDKLCLMAFQEAPKVFIQGKSLPSSNASGYKRMFISSGGDDEDDKICSVEELVLDYYKKKGYPKGIHCEVRTVKGLFGLFLWKVLYLPIPDAFRSCYQGAPLDLDWPHFYSSRKDKIDKRLKKMERWTLEEANLEIEKVWKENQNCVSVIDWSIFSSLEFTQGLVAALGLKLIAAICQRFAEDHRFTRSGFPDLIVWNPFEKKSRIVEVKGPNDILSAKQMLWLDYLLRHGATAEVCHVKAVGRKRTAALKSRRVSPRKREFSSVEYDTQNEVGMEHAQTKRKCTN